MWGARQSTNKIELYDLSFEMVGNALFHKTLLFFQVCCYNLTVWEQRACNKATFLYLLSMYETRKNSTANS